MTKRQVDKSGRSETFKVGDEVVLATQNLHSYAPHLPHRLKRRWVGHPDHLVSCISVGAADAVENPSGLPCQQSKMVSQIRGACAGGRATTP